MALTGSYATAIANLGTQKCRLMWVGDSLLEGQGAGTWEKRPPVDLLTRLRARYGVPEHNGAPIHRFYNGGEGSGGWASLGTVSNPASVTRDENYSLSKRGMLISAGNYWIAPTPSAPFQYVEVQYVQHTGLGQFGGFNVVDLAGPTTVLHVDNATADVGPTRAVYDYGSLGVRSVGVNPQEGLAYIDSVTFHTTHPDTGAGFASVDSTCSGIGSDAMLSGSAPWTGWASTGADLVIDDLWHNDALAGSATPAQSASRFADRVARYRSIRADIDIVLVMMWDAPGVDETADLGLGYTFEDYRAAMRTAAATAGVAVFDLSTYGTPDSGWFRADGIHHNDTGYAEWLGLLDAWLADSLAAPLPARLGVLPVADARLGSTSVQAILLGTSPIWP